MFSSLRLFCCLSGRRRARRKGVTPQGAITAGAPALALLTSAPPTIPAVSAQRVEVILEIILPKTQRTQASRTFTQWSVNNLCSNFSFIQGYKSSPIFAKKWPLEPFVNCRIVLAPWCKNVIFNNQSYFSSTAEAQAPTIFEKKNWQIHVKLWQIHNQSSPALNNLTKEIQ